MKNATDLGIKKSALNLLIRNKGLNQNSKRVLLTKKHLQGIKKINSYDFKKNEEQTNINFLLELNNYKGHRHNLNLPVRGQRSRTNARTSKKRKKAKI